MKTVTTTRWMLYADMVNLIETEGGALSTLRLQEGWSVVRRTHDGQFAVVAVNGLMGRIVKVLPTLDRARAYNFAIAR